MKRRYYFLVLLGEGITLWLFGFSKITIPCLFKWIFTIPCPGCGLTRAFRQLFQFHILEAISYNILVLPIFLFLIFLNYYLIQDLIFSTHNLKKFFSYIYSHSYYWIILVVISEVWNLFHGV